MNQNEYEKKIKRKISRMQEIISIMEKKHGKYPSRDFNYYGGWSMGYYKGVLYVYEQILDEIQDYNKLKRKD